MPNLFRTIEPKPGRRLTVRLFATRRARLEWLKKHRNSYRATAFDAEVWLRDHARRGWRIFEAYESGPAREVTR